uniref:Uncharacterized protein n=1 Tax=Anguilla anguilla TaxID=7936 RepID=A0A0E9RQT3_ANGAN
MFWKSGNRSCSQLQAVDEFFIVSGLLSFNILRSTRPG